MPLFGSFKKKEKCSEPMPDYPRQQTAPTSQVDHFVGHQSVYGPGTTRTIVQQRVMAVYPTQPPSMHNSTVVHVSFNRSEPGFFERLLDGPEFCNPVHDPRVPPAPGSFMVYTSNDHPQPPQMGYQLAQGYGYSPSMPSAPPSSSMPSSSTIPPPPSYEDVLAQEIKKKL